MGIDTTVKNLSPKRLKLFETLILIGLVLILTHFAFVFIVDLHMNIFNILGHSILYEVIVGGVLLGVAWNILHGKGLKIPENKPSEFKFSGFQNQGQTQNQSTTTCWNCKKTYPFKRSMFGDTKVKCPYCNSEGLIKRKSDNNE